MTLFNARFAATLVPATALLLAATTQTSNAQVILDEDFTAAQGYTDGFVTFQGGSIEGAWLGQSGTIADTGERDFGVEVDSTAGTVTAISGAPTVGVAGGGDAFLRNGFNNGVSGGTLGFGGDETGNGFTQGDAYNISFDFSFTLSDADGNFNLGAIGITDCLSTCGFVADVRAGVNFEYAEFGGGNLLVQTDQGVPFLGNEATTLSTGIGVFGISDGTTPDDPDTVDPTLIDLTSDQLRISYSAELIDEAADLWQTTVARIENLDTGVVLAEVVRDGTNDDQLATYFWNDQEAVVDIFNPENDIPAGVAGNTTLAEDGVTTLAGTDAYLSASWINDFDADGATFVEYSRVFFEFLPVGGIPSVDGDVNGDESVDGGDLVIVRDSIGALGADIAADVTGDDSLGTPDGDVDQFDYDFVAGNFTPAAAVASASVVPEPASAALLLLATSVAAVRRRKA